MSPDAFDSIYSLPISSRREEIISSVDKNQVTIITAETGAGKSTQVPQYLAEAGYKKIIVTQPRILAARNLCGRVRQEYSWRTSKDATDLVGYRTAHERDDSPDTVILYCTDGLQLVRELTGSGIKERQILILDEVHEWNENMEVLVAWAKKRCLENPEFKVVLMSATIESASLAAYYGSGTPISVEGRSFAVEKRYAKNLITEITELLKTRNSNMLVFLPGKAEIETVAEAIQVEAGSTIPIIPLHSQLEPAAQQLAFASYPGGKVILSTNIAQTSVTIDDIDVVIDSGLERRAEVRSGVEGLFIAETSQADCLQRAGRAGRTKEGLYILARLGAMPCSPFENREAYAVPEIMRKHIDRLVLRLANIGIDIEDLDFYHAPSRKSIKLAKHTLISLGALTADKRVTPIGTAMEKFPVESSFARMLVESKKYSEAIQAKVAAIIAIQEVGGIVKGGPRYVGWRKYTQQTRSDLVAQYDVYLAIDQIDPMDYEEFGILSKNITKANDIIERLNKDLALNNQTLSPVTDAELPELLKCIVAGQLHQLWAIEEGNLAIHLSTRMERELSSTTVVAHASLVAGRPFDLQVPASGGLETLNLVNDLTAVEPRWLEELAPESFRTKPGKVYYEPRSGSLALRTQLQFNGQLFDAASSPLLEHSSDNKRLFVNLYSAWVFEQLEKERISLQAINSRRIPQIPLQRILQQVRHLADGAVALAELTKSQRIELSKLNKVETHLGNKFMATLSRHDDGKKHRQFTNKRSWKPHLRKHFERHNNYNQHNGD